MDAAEMEREFDEMMAQQEESLSASHSHSHTHNHSHTHTHSHSHSHSHGQVLGCSQAGSPALSTEQDKIVALTAGGNALDGEVKQPIKVSNVFLPQKTDELAVTTPSPSITLSLSLAESLNLSVSPLADTSVSHSHSLSMPAESQEHLPQSDNAATIMKLEHQQQGVEQVAQLTSVPLAAVVGSKSKGLGPAGGKDSKVPPMLKTSFLNSLKMKAPHSAHDLNSQLFSNEMFRQG